MEEEILRALTELRNRAGSVERYMFVFPLSGMSHRMDGIETPCASMRSGDVLLLYREGAPSPF